ncbi:hypothetical protein AGMMS49545_02130 [Betaproteobacteria bacterium]|nr:hypothetical protein AGMMS49545_02130 [Betaproteobacteria bacterium]GHU43840.1 hypothetical protein AGMMS50289_10980 [Betaproteobacteria bacterium]
MTLTINDSTTLTVDLDVLGNRFERLPFRVQLRTVDLTCLIRDALENAYRVYELFLIDRPGDIWDYVWVVPEELSERVQELVSELQQKNQDGFIEGEDDFGLDIPELKIELAIRRGLKCLFKDGLQRLGSAYAHPNHWIPFRDFDRLFYYADEDTYPEDAAWRGAVDSSDMRAFAQKMLAMVRDAQNEASRGDPLLRHISARILSGEHPYCHFDRITALRASRNYQPPAEDGFTPAFYAKLGSLLEDPDLTSVAYRAGDYRVLRMMANEQCRRAKLAGHEAKNSLILSALNCSTISNAAWDAKITLIDDGIVLGDLIIAGFGGKGALKKLVEVHHRVPGRWILSSDDEGDIAGFTMEAGEGWVLYTRQTSDSRRASIR